MREKNTKIMVVEDEFIVGIDIKQTLQKSNYTVTSIVSSGEAAIKKAAIDKPDLILMDITLKGDLDGIETAAVITSKLGIPIIYITALCDDAVIERALSTKPLGYLFKPFNPLELCSSVKSALAQSSVS